MRRGKWQPGPQRGPGGPQGRATAPAGLARHAGGRAGERVSVLVWNRRLTWAGRRGHRARRGTHAHRGRIGCLAHPRPGCPGPHRRRTRSPGRWRGRTTANERPAGSGPRVCRASGGTQERLARPSGAGHSPGAGGTPCDSVPCWPLRCLPCGGYPAVAADRRGCASLRMRSNHPSRMYRSPALSP